ncbi:helix-turn-helix domain-containing protein [Aquimarina sp. M1]
MVSINLFRDRFKKSRQYLNKVFKKEVLYSLKRFIITIRIMDLIKFKVKNDQIFMTELCYRYEYFDQSHFNHDFKKVCGVAPIKF